MTVYCPRWLPLYPVLIPHFHHISHFHHFRSLHRLPVVKGSAPAGGRKKNMYCCPSGMTPYTCNWNVPYWRVGDSKVAYLSVPCFQRAINIHGIAYEHDVGGWIAHCLTAGNYSSIYSACDRPILVVEGYALVKCVRDRECEHF